VTLPGAEPKLEKVKEGQIELNHPLKFDGYALYQAGYQQNEFSKMSFKLDEANDGDQQAIDTFTIDLTKPETEYKVDNGFKVVMQKYYPDYYFDEDYGEPRSETNDPRNPAFIFKVYSPKNKRLETIFVVICQKIDSTTEIMYNL